MDVMLTKQCGEVIATMRREAGLTQVELAARLRVTQSFISKVENGERSLRVYEQYAYARALGLPVGTFVDRIGSGVEMPLQLGPKKR